MTFGREPKGPAGIRVTAEHASNGSRPEQLPLIPDEPRPLTPRQQEALEHLRRAGHDGLTATELGTILYGNRPEARSWGASALQALRKRGYARQRGRPPVWVALTEPGIGGSGATGATTAAGRWVATPGLKTDAPPGSVSAHPPDGLPVYGSFPILFGKP